jgi:group I intron endonuclease
VIRKNRSHKSKPVAKQRLTNMTGGIYTIKNKKENKIYVGQSIMIEQRRTQHLTDLRGGRHQVKELQEDFNRLGEQSFEHQIYQELDKDDALSIKLKELETMLKFRDDGWSLYNSEER